MSIISSEDLDERYKNGWNAALEYAARTLNINHSSVVVEIVRGLKFSSSDAKLGKETKNE